MSCCKEATTELEQEEEEEEEERCLGQETQGTDIDQWKSEYFGSTHHVSVGGRKGERMVSTRVFPTVKH